MSSTSLARLLVFGSLLLPCACKSNESSSPAPPPPEGRRGEITNEFTARAEVVAVDAARRVLTVRREDGTQIELAASQAVRNFDQIGVGDELRLRYRETLVATELPPGTAPRQAQGAIAAARAKPGEKPGAGMGMAISLPVKIESIDREHQIVVFSPASGELIARRIRTAQGREFVEGLSVGDTVQLDYLEVVALEVEEL